MSKQCYLIDHQLKFFFVSEDRHLDYQGNRQSLNALESDVLQYMFEHNTDGVIAVEDILQAHFADNADKKQLMQLLFALNKKFKALGFNQEGFHLNGPNYLITFQYELIDGYQHQLHQIREKRLQIRRYLFFVLFLLVIFIMAPG